jgi:LuxR family maltose regulon positive regulatory protein
MLADMRVAQGRLGEARSIYQRSLQRAEELSSAAPRGTADLHVGMSELDLEQGDLDSAVRHLRSSQELGETAGLPENRFRWYIAMAAARQAEQDYDGALELLDQAERLFAPGFSPDMRPLHALRTRVWLSQGRLADALDWVRDHRLTVDGELAYLKEFEHLTLARVLIAQADRERDQSTLHAAAGLLDRLIADAEAGVRNGAVIEALVLKAIVSRALDDAPGALAHLHRAIEIAEPEGYVRVFVDAGPHVEALLRELAKRSLSPYVSRLLAAFQHRLADAAPVHASSDALSARELEVMRLLSTDLSGPDIARELVVSLNTMRTHTKNIYTKLGVTTRREAVRRAQEQHLL